jgi:DNA-binding transcriptional LysR family regulator
MKTAPDRIELMQTFVRIVEAGSLSAAAAQMNATQPTVSRRLQALERSLGLKLLQRSTHAMKLTEDGALLCPRQGVAGQLGCL